MRATCRRAALALLLAVASIGCDRRALESAQPRADAFDEQRAFEEVRAFVALGPRDAGTPGAERAATYLRDRLRSFGLDAEIDTFIDLTPLGERKFHNVIGRIAGTQPGVFLVGSHFDTRSGIGPAFEGANDSGSSTGILLELARLLADAGWTGPAIEFVFFDGEEAVAHYSPIDGLHGSRYYANKIVKRGRKHTIRAMILLDMVGDRDLTVTLPRNVTPALAARVLDAAAAEGAREKFGLFPFQIGDDHEPFLRAGIPAVNIIDFQFGSAPGRNDYWHTLEDSMDKISAASLGIIGRVTLRTLQDLAANPLP